MNKFRFTIKTLAVLGFMLGVMSVAQAQATRTWVSGVGDDANPCSRTAPCKTFAGAISKTAADGEIDCLDPGGFGTVTITKSITIDGTPTGVGSILNSGVPGIIINITAETAPHNLHTVVLRNLSIQGAGSGTDGVRVLSGNVTGLKVIVDNCFISGQNAGGGRGIEDFRNNGGLLSVSNTTITNCLAAGLVVDPAGSGGAGASLQTNVSISNSRINGNGFGANFGSNVKANIFETTIVGNASSGVFAIQTASGGTEVSVDHCVVSSNGGIGFNASTANMVIRVSNTTALNNASLASVAGGGQVNSYGNNQTGGTAFPGAVGQT